MVIVIKKLVIGPGDESLWASSLLLRCCRALRPWRFHPIVGDIGVFVIEWLLMRRGRGLGGPRPVRFKDACPDWMMCGLWLLDLYLMYSWAPHWKVAQFAQGLASIWRIRSRVTSKIWPISSRVFMRPSSGRMQAQHIARGREVVSLL